MKPGLVVKLRPTGPWRIGPDSGARNRVDAIYHSDSLYSAVTSAMARMGSLEEWLDATARAARSRRYVSAPVSRLWRKSSFVAPPRTVWPPRSPALMSAHVRWKSARFVPLSMVQTILTGKPLDENRWSVDGASGCLMPGKRQGPFRTGVRWNAAVDRLTGATERHSVGCIEFRPGCGLWTVVSFADDAARDRWQGPVKAAFRWLADSGFGGERSRGWGRAEAPEFVEGRLPGMILAQGPDVFPPPVQEPPHGSASGSANHRRSRNCPIPIRTRNCRRPIRSRSRYRQRRHNCKSRAGSHGSLAALAVFSRCRRCGGVDTRQLHVTRARRPRG